MPNKQVSDTEIAISIVPTMLMWPDSDLTSWQRMRDSVEALRSLVRVTADQCVEIEGSTELLPQAILKRVADIGKTAIASLNSFAPLRTAEKAVANNLTLLQEKMKNLPGAPATYAEVHMAQELRQHVARMNSPIDFVMKNMADARLVSAVLSAPYYLSGLLQSEWNLVASRARQSLHPEQVEMEASLTKGLNELREGRDATRRMLLARTGTRIDDNGIVRAIYEQQPKQRLAG